MSPTLCSHLTSLPLVFSARWPSSDLFSSDPLFQSPYVSSQGEFRESASSRSLTSRSSLSVLPSPKLDPAFSSSLLECSGWVRLPGWKLFFCSSFNDLFFLVDLRDSHSLFPSSLHLKVPKRTGFLLFVDVCSRGGPFLLLGSQLPEAPLAYTINSIQFNSWKNSSSSSLYVGSTPFSNPLLIPKRYR